MFVINHERKPLRYNINGRTIVINPGMNCIDTALFPIEGLMTTYGPAIISIVGEEAPVVEEPKAEEAKKAEEEAKKAEEEAKKAEEEAAKAKAEKEAKAKAKTAKAQATAKAKTQAK